MANQTDSGKKCFVAAEAIGQNIRVKLNSSEQIAIAGAGEAGIGTMEDSVASGDVGTVRLWSHPGTRTVVAAASVAINTEVYFAAAGKFSGTVSGPKAGLSQVSYNGQTTAASGDGSEFEILPYPVDADLAVLLYNNTTVGTAVTATTSETDLDSFSIPANMLKAGDEIEIEGWGICTATNSTDTLAVNVKVGSVTVCAIPAVDVANNNIWRFRMVICVRTVGASGTIVGHGNAGALGATGSAELMRTLNSSSLDTTAAVAVKHTATWSTNNAGNSCRSEQFAVRLRRRAA